MCILGAKIKQIAGLILLLFLLESFISLPHCTRRPHVIVGGGYYFAGPNHSGGIVQLEYRSENFFFNYFRPQVTLALPELKGAFLGAGIGVDLYVTDHIVLSPSFEPGVYYKGGSRDLGYPIEFRSTFEAAYETDCGWRWGAQFYHISNASLGKHNPGAEALVFFLGIPLK